MEVIKREIVNEFVVLTYEDGSVETLHAPDSPRSSVFDAESDPEINSGHVFEESEIQ